MNAAMDGRKFRFRSVIAAFIFVTLVTVGLSLYKRQAMDSFGPQALEVVRLKHSKLLTSFQANFYFFYEDQFIPSVKELLQPSNAQNLPALKGVQIWSTAESSFGQRLYDSSQSKKPTSDASQLSKDLLSLHEPEIRIHGFYLDVFVPAGLSTASSNAVLYVYQFEAVQIKLTIIAGFLLSILFSFVIQLSLVKRGLGESKIRIASFWRKFWRLRARYIFAIIVINVFMAGFSYFSLVSFQTREQTQKIEKESLLFGEFSTQEIVSNFMNYFYFYYGDRFVPSIRKIISSNENLQTIRIISKRTGQVLFNSQLMDQEGGGGGGRSDLSPEVEDQLRGREVASVRLSRNGEQYLTVVSVYKNESKEPLFLVEYIFSYNSLKKDLAAIKSRILFDMLPTGLVGIFLAIVFAQLMISPIRKIVEAHRLVADGDYDISVNIKNTDEIGDMAVSFNAMTAELRKKRELRKYLSDSTYRQIMEAPDSPDGLKLAGTRTFATVLFTDIRNFVGHCEALEAEEVTAMLNEHFSGMVDVVYKHGGEVDKFIGDALLAVFYAADDFKTIRKAVGTTGVAAATGATTSLQAIYCALEMRERLTEFNAKREQQGKTPIEIGVGITFGEIISGPIGAKDRMDFTVIGDVVNLASRIEKLSKQGKYTKVVFAETVEEKVRGLLDYHEFASEKIKGKEEPVRVFELIGIRDLKILVQNLESQDLSLRKRSLELLGQSRNQEALPPVLHALKSKNEDIILAASIAIGKLAKRDDKRALDALFACLDGDPSERIISSVIAVLGRICTSERLLDLGTFLNHPEERIVANAVEAIGQLRDAKAMDLLLPKLGSLNNRIKANAAMALFAAGHVEVIDTLKPMLLHSNPLMRSSAAFAIGELTLIAAQQEIVDRWKRERNAVQMFLAELQEAVPMLVALLRDADTMVKRQAVIALGKIKDKSAVLPIIDMVNPNESDRELIKDISQALRSIGSHSLVREVIARLSSS